VKYWAELYGQVFAIGFIAGVLGNLTASLILGTPALWHLHRKLNRQHQWHVDNANAKESNG